MTCIVGVRTDAGVWIGGDSISTNGHDVDLSVQSKVFQTGPFLIGFGGSWRMGQILEHLFAPPPRYPSTDVFAYMVTTFMESVRECFQGAGFEWKDEGSRDRRFMVGYEGRLFICQNDYAVLEWTSGYGALGAASEYATGALCALKGYSLPERIEIALAAAEELTTGCRGPFVVKKLETA